MLASYKEWDYLGFKYRFVTRHTVYLPVHVETPGVEVAATVTLAQTSVLYWVGAVTTGSDQEGVEITDGHLVNLFVVKLVKMMDSVT